MDEIKLRPLAATDEPFLRDLIWLAAHWSEQSPVAGALGRELEPYVEGFGRRGDRGVLALASRRPVGGCWIREMSSGYGFVADGVGELSIAVKPAFRGRGIGRSLMAAVLEDEAGSVSLSVHPENPAVRLYEGFGFVRVGERGGSLLMLRQ